MRPLDPDSALVWDALNTIIDPCSVAAGAPAGLGDMGLLRSLVVRRSAAGLHVSAVVGVTEIGCLMAAPFLHDAYSILDGLTEVVEANVELDAVFDWMPEDMSPDYQEHLAARHAVGRKHLLPLTAVTQKGRALSDT